MLRKSLYVDTATDYQIEIYMNDENLLVIGAADKRGTNIDIGLTPVEVKELQKAIRVISRSFKPAKTEKDK